MTTNKHKSTESTSNLSLTWDDYTNHQKNQKGQHPQQKGTKKKKSWTLSTNDDENSLVPTLLLLDSSQSHNNRWFFCSQFFYFELRRGKQTSILLLGKLLYYPFSIFMIVLYHNTSIYQFSPQSSHTHFSCSTYS